MGRKGQSKHNHIVGTTIGHYFVKQITKKRESIKNAQRVLNDITDCHHVDEFSYIDGLDVVTKCKFCSRTNRMGYQQFVVYTRQHKQEI